MAGKDTNGHTADLPRDDLFRAVYPGVELRDDNADGMPVMAGHLAVFNEWTEINSLFEGRFLERLSPGAFTKTIKENRDKMRVLFQHGQDPQVGDKPLGPIAELREEAGGVAYEVPLLDTSYNRDLLPGLKAGLYGASFRFKVMKEDITRDAKPSAYNPDGLPERTITEVQMREFGPVTFPAYDGATAGIRSTTDLFRPAKDEQREETKSEALAEEEPATTATPSEPAATDEQKALDTTGAEESHSDQPSRPTVTATQEKNDMNITEKRARVDEIKSRMSEISKEFSADRLDDTTQAEWDGIEEEKTRLEADIADVEKRTATVAAFANDETRVETTHDPVVAHRGRRQLVPADPHDYAEYRTLASGMDELSRGYREGAQRIVESMDFAHPEAKREDQQERVSRLLNTIDGRDRELAQRVIITTSETYKRAFGKWLGGVGLSPEEQRTLSLTTTAGGYAVPVTLDPTVILTSNGVVNPIRQLARIETISGNVWEGITSAGITAAYSAEAVETTDNAPVIAQPVANVEKAQAFVPFSIEISEDWGALQSEMARMFQDAKDTLEADKFLTGLGHSSQLPQGLLVGATAVVASATTATFAVADVYSLESALAPRWRPRAVFVANRAAYNKVRQFDTAGGANLWVQLQGGFPPTLVGYNAYEYSNYSSAVTTTASSILTIGDFSQFLIVDRVGMNVELVPHLFGTVANYPTGQRGLYCYWRNTSIVLTQLAFKTLKLL